MIRKLRAIDILLIVITFAIIEISAFYNGIDSKGFITSIIRGNIRNIKNIIFVIIYFILFFVLISFLSQYLISKEKGIFVKGVIQRFVVLLKFGLPLMIIFDIIGNVIVNVFTSIASHNIDNIIGKIILNIAQFIWDFNNIFMMFLMFFIVFYIPIKKENKITIKEYFKIEEKNKRYIIIIVFILLIIVIAHVVILYINATYFRQKFQLNIFYLIDFMFSKHLTDYIRLVFYFIVDIILFLFHIKINSRDNKLVSSFYKNNILI